MKFSLNLLRITTASLFLGWGLVHIMGDVPYREFLWSEWLFRPILEFFGGDWQSYVNNTHNDEIIQWCTTGIGIALIGLSVLALVPFRQKVGRLLWLGSGILLVVFLLYFKGSGFKLGLLFEQTAQLFCPIVLYYACFGNLSKGKMTFLIKTLISTTFLFHGLFAIGLFSVPGNFIDMIISVFNVSEGSARSLLLLAGILDVILAVTIFVPEIERPVLIYAVVWGTLTSLARPVSLLSIGGGWESFFFWSAQFLLRAPHFGLPLYLLLSSSPAPVRRQSLVTNTLRSEVG